MGHDTDRPARKRGLRTLAWAFVGLGSLAGDPAGAQQVLNASGDVTVALGPGDLVVRDEQVVADNQLGIVALESIGPIPANADVTGYGQGAGVTRYLSFETTVLLAGGVVARTGDVVEWNGTSHAIVFAAASVPGFPAGVRTDAIATGAGGQLLLSFDADVALPGGLIAADEDLVAWDGNDLSLAFDGSAAGLDRRLDVDGAGVLPDGRILLSFDTGGTAPGASGATIAFQDEDVLRHDAGVFTRVLDLSALDADWGAADLDAFELVPEPHGSAPLLAALSWLAGLGWRRRREVSGGRVPPVGPALCTPRRSARSAGATAILTTLALAAAITTSEARAGDGRAEINQACAVATGCFPGDSPGFPVTIDGSAGSAYRLTSDLVVADPNVSAIFLAQRSIQIDFAGHAIRGPRDCSARPAPCGPIAGSGAGIDAGVDTGLPGPTTARFTGHLLSEGLVTGMASEGIRVGSAIVRSMRIESNGGNGIDFNAGGQIEESYVARNGGIGVRSVAVPPFPVGRVEVRDSVILANGLEGLFIERGDLTRNAIESNLGAGVRASSDCLLIENSVRQNGADGISIETGGRSLLVGNVVVANAGAGIDLGAGAGVPHSVQRNLIDGNSGAGLSIPNRGAYRENTLRAGVGGTTVSNPLAIDLGANACNGGAACP